MQLSRHAAARGGPRAVPGRARLHVQYTGAVTFTTRLQRRNGAASCREWETCGQHRLLVAGPQRCGRRSCSRQCSAQAGNPDYGVQSGELALGVSEGGTVELPTTELEPDELLPAGDSPWARRWQLLRSIAAFALPALAIPLGDPLMSLVDTVCIGQYGTTRELAALAPCNLIFQFCAYAVASLATACTCLMSELLELRQERQAAAVLSTSLVAGAVVGGAQMLLLLACGRSLIVATGCAPELVAPAWRYLRIRALATPSVLLLMVAQSGLLSQKDSRTPSLGILAQLLLNVGGDLLLIRRLSMGLAGAAWATVASQWAGCLVTLACLCRGPVRPRLAASLADFRRLSETFGPATLVTLAKNLIYAGLAATAAALPPLQAAAHQLVFGVWCLGSFAQVPMEQAALAFVPSAAARNRAREAVGLLLGLSLAVGAATAFVTAVMPALVPQWLTSKAELYPIIRSVAPQAVLAILLCALDVCASGILVATKQLATLVRVMAAALPIVLCCLAAGRRQGWGLAGVWWSLVLFFLIRTGGSLSRLAQLARTPGSLLHAGSQAGAHRAARPKPGVA